MQTINILPNRKKLISIDAVMANDFDFYLIDHLPANLIHPLFIQTFEKVLLN